MIVSVSESDFGLQISQPPNITQKWFCIQNLHMDLSFQKKKRFRNLFLGSQDIKQIQKIHFFRHPVSQITLINYVIDYHRAVFHCEDLLDLLNQEDTNM